MEMEQFIQRWNGQEGGAERANYILFLSELTDVLGIPQPEPADSRSTYRFEYPVEGDFGQKLRIDLYRENHFILEAKQSRLEHRSVSTSRQIRGQPPGRPLWASIAPQGGRRRARWEADMNAAFRQARGLAHRLSPEVDRPPFLITCDVGRQLFRVRRTFPGQGRAYRPLRESADRT